MVDTPGGSGPSTKPETGDAASPQPMLPADQVALIRQVLAEALPTALGLLPGQNISHVTVSAAQNAVRQLEEKLLKRLEGMQKPAESPPQQDAVKELAHAVEELKKERDTARDQMEEQKRISLIRSVIDSKGIDPSVKSAITSLVSNGLEGARKPTLDGDQLIVTGDDGIQVPFEGYLDNYLQTRASWALSKPTAKGVGGKGGVQTPAAMPVTIGSVMTREGQQKMNELAKSDPAAANQQLEQRTASLKAKMARRM